MISGRKKNKREKYLPPEHGLSPPGKLGLSAVVTSILLVFQEEKKMEVRLKNKYLKISLLSCYVISAHFFL